MGDDFVAEHEPIHTARPEEIISRRVPRHPDGYLVQNDSCVFFEEEHFPRARRSDDAPHAPIKGMPFRHASKIADGEQIERHSRRLR